MLPDFPKIKREIQNNLEKYVRNISYSDPLISMITKITIYEGNKGIYYTVDGKKQEVEYKNFESKVNIKAEEVKEKGTDIIKEIGKNVGKDIKQQLGNHMISSIHEAIDRTGNKINANGKPLSHEFILDTIEKMEISFNDDGTPNMPSLILHPDQLKKIQDKIPEWEKNKDYIKRKKEIMEVKKSEWDIRESNRKLVN
ncbi:MAG: SNARE domain-containing protein [Candidatus Nanoarchaeia archaeon]